ncbi:MAG TPA: cyclic-phosphate processing receiver domain-containing protein [Bacilli bacterium]
MAINVFLDDMRRVPPGFVAARSLEEFLAILEADNMHIVSLDFDLGPGRPDGTDVVRAMIDRNRFADEIYLHSSNMQGRLRMYDLLRRHVPATAQIFCHPVPDDLLAQIAQAAAAKQ